MTALHGLMVLPRWFEEHDCARHGQAGHVRTPLVTADLMVRLVTHECAVCGDDWEIVTGAWRVDPVATFRAPDPLSWLGFLAFLSDPAGACGLCSHRGCSSPCPCPCHGVVA